MDENLESLLAKLKNAVSLMMAHDTHQAQRYEAYQACEEFKEKSPYCVQFGFLMADKSSAHIIRHFGLQLLEHSVKYKWNDMSVEDKCYLKNNTLKLMAEGTFDILEEQTHIKDGISRVMVEIIKREWPQQYTDMLNDFHNLCSMGPGQTELVLLIFLRLSEDVMVFRTVPQQRRREVLTGLNMNMEAIFNFFINTLTSSYEGYTTAIKPGGNVQQGQRFCKVTQAVLETLAVYLDWVSGSYVFGSNGLLLCLLCVMLEDVNLQLPASECLLVITNRKGKPEERKPILLLFSDEAMTALLKAVCTANAKDLEEHHYLFLKKLCQVLTTIGSQLLGLWGCTIEKEGIGRPVTFEKYLKAIIAFTQHPSQFLGKLTQSLWTSFLRHEHIRDDSLFKDVFVPELIASTKKTLLKVGFPSQNNSPSCAYAAQDFDSDEDFTIFFSKYRADVADTLRHCTLVSPLVAFQFMTTWIQDCLNTPIDIGKDCELDLCNLSSPSFLAWDALSLYMESVMQRLDRTDARQAITPSGLRLLKSLLWFNTRDPLVYSCLLSCISSLVSFLDYEPSVLSPICDKIFAAAVFSLEGQTKSTRSRAVRNVRRHACSVLVKICKQYPHLLFPGLETIYSHIKKLCEDPDELSQLEKNTLMEALVLISNQFKNFQKQSSFVAEIMAPVSEMWLSPAVKEALWSPVKFMSYIGLDQAPVEPSSADTCGINRSHLLHCANVFQGVLNRCGWPSIEEEARTGGFIYRTDSNGRVSYKNPVTPHLIPLMDNMLACMRTLNEIWLPEHIARRHPEFAKAYEMLDTEKQIILGIPPPCVDNTYSTATRQPLERMQSFMTNIHDMCYHILGNAGQSMGFEFYQAPNLAQSLANSVFSNIEYIPDYRLKIVIRAFLKPFASCCPKECYESVLLPLLECVCPYMLQRLSVKWKNVSEDLDSGDADDRDPESEEVLQEQLLRVITREYMEFIGSLIKDRKDQKDEVVMDEDEQPTHSNEFTFSELGLLLLASQRTYPAIVITIFSGLTWPDTMVCNKSINFCFPVLKHLIESNRMTGADVCHVYTNILQSLQMNGQHEAQQGMLLGLGVQVYEFLRPHFHDVTNVMLQIPSCSQSALQAFDEKILNVTPQKAMSDKRKKDSYKKLVSGVIGQNVGQQFKREAKIKDLPPIMKLSRAEKAALLQNDSKDLGISSLFKLEDDDL